MEKKEKKFITSGEVANLIGVSRTTLGLWIKKMEFFKKNNIPVPENFRCPRYGRVGNRYMFLREDVENFVKDSIKD